ncbi:MAG: MobF family relaxase [Candidatus Acidiferrum sp.]
MLTIRAIANGDGYDSHYLAQDDYYSVGERIPGEWFGHAAESLGLRGAVQHEAFDAVRQGQHPESGKFLRARHGADRYAQDGTVQSKARAMYDFTLSAPKSISVLAAFVDERLIAAHREAVAATLRELETHATARIRKHGLNESRNTSNVAIAVYHHDTSRELDPQLHAHCVAANLTYDDAEQRWKALNPTGIYERRAYLSEVYRNALAHEVLKLGYTIHNRIDGKGRDIGFEVDGVARETLEKFSQRSAQRDEAIRGFAAQKGRQPTDREIALLVRENRREKQVGISPAEVKQIQRERLAPHEESQLHAIRESVIPASPEQVRGTRTAAASLQHAEDHVFERVSVAADYAVLTEALRHGRGRIELDQLHGSLKQHEESGIAFRHRDEIATRESLDRERRMVEMVDAGIGQHSQLGKSLAPPSKLNEEQKHAVQFILASRDFAVNLRGAAGAGKTLVLEDLRRALIAGGREVIAIAPSVSAVEELAKVGFANASTVAKFLDGADTQGAARGKVVILDEAGMVSARDMELLLAKARQSGMRVIFAGDTKQLRSVDAGDALRILERDSQIKSTSLTRVQRQAIEQYRDAVQVLRHNPARGYDQLEAMGAIQHVPEQDRAAEVCRAYRAISATPARNGENRTALILAATHDELGHVTAAIRSDRMERAQLPGNRILKRHKSLDFTLAKRKDSNSYAPEHLLVFHRKSKGIRKHEVLEVVRNEGVNLIVRTDRGRERVVTPQSQAGSFGVFERTPFELACGDRLLLMENRRDSTIRVKNGEIATVAAIGRNGAIRLNDGRTLPPDYRRIDYGYAITTHRAQGKSVDAVIISADAMQRELFYVAATRARESITVVTSDPAGLRDSIAVSGARESATDLHRRANGHAHLNAARAAQEQTQPKQETQIEVLQAKGVGYGI